MNTIEDSIEINAGPDRVFAALLSIFSATVLYKKWHNDHVKCEWIKGKRFEIGSVISIEEYLHDELHKLKFAATRLEPNRKIEFKILFPASMLSPGGSFIIQPKNEGCIFTAALSFRMAWLLSIFAKSRVEAIKKHMKEEGENLKSLVEGRLV